jgi:hypothetical protein
VVSAKLNFFIRTQHYAQGSRVIIVVVQVGAMKIYAAEVEALRRKGRGDETQFTTKIDVKTSLSPNYFLL